MQYHQTVAWLFEQFPAYHNLGKEAYNPGLKNILELSAYFENPHQKLQFIHVAGTNGKGSVSNMCASILTESGEKVGLYTSPHIVDFKERIRVNGKTIDKQYVIEFCKKIRTHQWKIKPSFFEITWMMALCYFADQKCSIVVAEVGLGGRLDATNIITPLISCITNIGLDHTAILGATKEEIAKEKAGIIKPTIPLVLGEKDNKIATIIKEIASLQHSAVYLPPSTYSEKVTLLGYQNQNYSIVSAICDHIEKLGFACNSSIRELGIKNLKKNTGFFGRLEILATQPLIIADCAHNAEGVYTLLESVTPLNKGKLHLIYGTSSDKDVESICALLPKDASFYFTEFSNNRSIKLNDLKEKTQSIFQKANYFQDPLKAFNTAQSIANKEDTILIFGSFFLLHDFFDFFSN